MMIRTINVQSMLKGVRRFILDNPIDPPNVEVTALAADVDSAIAAIDTAAATQTEGAGDASGGVTSKRIKAKELRAYLKDVCLVGRALDPDAHPGVAAHFILPRNHAYAVLSAFTRAIIAESTPVSAAMIALGLPATFLADLNALLTAFEEAVDAKIDGLQTQVGGTSGLRFRTRQGMKAAKKLDAIIRAVFRNDSVRLDVWKHARHVERQNETGSESGSGTGSDPVGTGTGSGTGSGGV